MITRRFIMIGLIGVGAAPGFYSAVDMGDCGSWKAPLLNRSRGP
jgi:hypothetical protein